MNKILKRLICLCLVPTFLLIAACGGEKADDAAADFCRINGQDLYFLSEGDLLELREPLVKLLSNRESWTDGEDMGFYSDPKIPDPSLPSIPDGAWCGLFDVTSDGMPELLVEPYGYTGSSGGRTWFVYDIQSGAKIGEINGGIGDIWCDYYYTEDSGIYPICRSVTRGGWDYLSIKLFTIERDSESGEYESRSFFRTEQQIMPPEEKYGTEDYTRAEYYLFGERVMMTDYYYAYSTFGATCVRIPETELILIGWDDVSSDGDDRFVRAEKMADALFSSGQKFIAKNNSKG